MPELPEVETMRRGLLGVIGHSIVSVGRVRCRSKPIVIRPHLTTFRAKAIGRRIEAIERRGKRVVVRLDNQHTIVFEPRMTGLVLLADPPDRKGLRFKLELSPPTPQIIWYWDRRGLGNVRLLTPDQFEEVFHEDRIGPDALEVTAEVLRQRLAESRREIKPALLDQRVVAGIGNLYASEILHVARIDPRRPCREIGKAQWRKLQQAIRQVLEEAVRLEGSTLSDGTYRNALNQAGGYQNHHRVYDRQGLTCPTCHRAVLERTVQSQRSTFFCATCQTN